MEDVVILEKGIYECAPQVPFVQDQIGAAIKWAKEVLDEDEFLNAMKVAYETSKYTAKTSEGNFYKTHLVIGALLSFIPNVLEDEKFKSFDSASKAVENTLRAIIPDEEITEKRGKYKALSMHLVPLGNKDQDCFTIMLIKILNNLEDVISEMKDLGIKTPITDQDYISILGYNKVMTDIYLAKVPLYNETHDIFNKINIILNEDVDF